MLEGKGLFCSLSLVSHVHYHSTNNTYSSSSSYSYHKDKRAKLGDILAKHSSLGKKIFLSSKF